MSGFYLCDASSSQAESSWELGLVHPQVAVARDHRWSLVVIAAAETDVATRTSDYFIARKYSKCNFVLALLLLLAAEHESLDKEAASIPRPRYELPLWTETSGRYG